MCGICGIVSDEPGIDLLPTLMKMNQAIIHRGPDDTGSYSKDGYGIAMRRLSIIDIDGGCQPIFNEDGQIGIVFNGEIYNYLKIRDDLMQRGHQFQTQSDTETILHLYEEEGERTPIFLKGMFAFCIYDRRDQSLFIARDRFGEKPLFYHHHPRSGFVFSSEIRSLLACPLVPRILNFEALGYYLRLGYIPAPLTMLKDVFILRPGHWLRLQDGDVRIRPYYNIDYAPDPELSAEVDAVDAVRAALHQAVKRQSMSDVPLGAFLSGGIDSSSVVACLQNVSTQPVKTFNVRFEEASYDESPIAREVATRLGTDHHEIVVPNLAFSPDDVWRIVDHVGQPFLDSSAIPTYVLSQQIRQHVTVALSGDGGDEMFAGYSLFHWAQTIRSLQNVPRPLIQIASNLINRTTQMPAIRRIGALRRVRRGLDSALVPAHMLPVAIQTLFEPEELASLVRHNTVLDVALSDLNRYTDLPPEAVDWTPLRQLMYLRLKNNLHDDMLVKVDRMSMAASLEVRAPMLDVQLAELSMRLPDRHLVRGKIGKYVLRQAFRPVLPDSVFTHPKSGFSIPIHKFQNAAYKNLASDLLHKRDGVMQLFVPAKLEQILWHGLNQQSDHASHSVYRASHQLWSLVQLAAWSERFAVSLPQRQ